MWAIYKTRHIFRVKSAVDSWAVTKPLNWRRYTSESIKGIREMAFVTKMPIHCEETWTTLLYVPKRASLSFPRILAGSTVAKQLHSPRQNVLERRRCAKSRAWCHPQGCFISVAAGRRRSLGEARPLSSAAAHSVRRRERRSFRSRMRPWRHFPFPQDRPAERGTSKHNYYTTLSVLTHFPKW